VSVLIYGATGYSGELIARLAAERGLQPILAGRNATAVAKLASGLGVPHRAFALDDAAALDAGLDGVRVVLHCAGPFSHTSKPMLDACLRKKVHYLDLTGEVEVFEACAARDAEARAAGVMILPGVGFDVVPSDCLAAHLKRRLPSAKRLALAFRPSGGVSRGTATTVVENIDRGGMVRSGGELRRVPVAHAQRTIDFGRGPAVCVSFPWGDVATAWYSTRIPDITVYIAFPRSTRVGLKLSRMFAPILATRPMQRWLNERIRSAPPGPDAAARARGRTYLWGEVEDDAGGRAVSRLETPEVYALTAFAALEIVKRVMSGEAPAGFQTPSSAYGPDLVLALPDCTRTDE
jgi:short subunit dehydrogenase-like uncharacterized protein